MHVWLLAYAPLRWLIVVINSVVLFIENGLRSFWLCFVTSLMLMSLFFGVMVVSFTILLVFSFASSFKNATSSNLRSSSRSFLFLFFYDFSVKNQLLILLKLMHFSRRLISWVSFILLKLLIFREFCLWSILILFMCVWKNAFEFFWCLSLLIVFVQLLMMFLRFCIIFLLVGKCSKCPCRLCGFRETHNPSSQCWTRTNNICENATALFEYLRNKYFLTTRYITIRRYLPSNEKIVHNSNRLNLRYFIIPIYCRGPPNLTLISL